MSCLFNSLESLLKDELKNLGISNLRQIITIYMGNNLHEKVGDEKLEEWIKYSNIDEKIGKSVKDYVEKISNPSQWGGALEIAITSKIFNLKINVEMNNKIISVFECGETNNKEITLVYTGNHYVPGNSIQYT